MSKQTESNLFIFPSSERVAEFYQRLISGITSYEELGTRVLNHIKTAYAFRQVERVTELARVLINIPIREYQLIGKYYLVWCKCRETEYQNEMLESIIEQTDTYKSKALVSRGTFELYKGRSEAALYFYAEALKASSTTADYIIALRAITTAKSMEGFHASAIRDLERLLPLLRYADPLTYYEVINSYAVELNESNRLSEAYHASILVASSPFAPYYSEWQETLSAVRSKRKLRSTITISRQSIKQEDETGLEVQENVIRKARVRAVIDLMRANLHRSIALAEMAKTARLSPEYFLHIFKIETGIAPGQYLIKLKMDKAAHLLATTFLSVKEIMAEVGYSNRSNFLRRFRRHFEITPSEYRQQALT